MEAMHRLLLAEEDYIVGDLNHPRIELVTEHNGMLIDFTIVEGNTECSDFGAGFFIKVLADLNKYVKNDVAYLYSNLSKKGRVFFSGSERSFQNLPEFETEVVDYSYCCLGHLKCLETELVSRLGPILEACIAEIKKPFTLGTFPWALKNYRLAIETKLGAVISDNIIKNLPFFVGIRNNKVGHTGIVNLHQCKQVRRKLIDDGILGEILELTNKKQGAVHFTARDQINAFKRAQLLVIKGDVISDCWGGEEEDSIRQLESMMVISKTFRPFLNIGLCWLMPEMEIVCEVDRDVYGWIGLKSAGDERPWNVGVFDGKVVEREYGLQILLRVTMGTTDYPLYYKLIRDGNTTSIEPTIEALNLRDCIYREIGQRLGDRHSAIFAEAGKRIGTELIKLLDVGNDHIFVEIAKGIIVSESIWRGAGASVEQSYKTIQNIFQYILLNGNCIEMGEKRILVEACQKIICQHETIFDTTADYLYPYVTIDVADKRVVEVQVESAGQNEKFMFKIRPEATTNES